jgi:hypothetical protein
MLKAGPRPETVRSGRSGRLEGQRGGDGCTGRIRLFC